MKITITTGLSVYFFIAVCTSGFAQSDPFKQDVRRQLVESEKSRFIVQLRADQIRTRPNQNLFNISFYNLELKIDPDIEQLTGSVTIVGRSLTGALTQLEINLSANLQVDSIRQGPMPLSYSRSPDFIIITLPKALTYEDIFSITISYHGDPEQSGFGAFGWNYHGVPSTPIIWTLSEPYGAPSWWPCKDDPADKADSVFISVTVPNGLFVVANGLLSKTTHPDAVHTTYFWRTFYPISTYLVSLAISDYAYFSDHYVSMARDTMPVDFYVYPELLTAAREDLDVTVDMITYFASLFGEYPFLKEKYGLALFPWAGAMEHQTITSYGSGLITGTHFFDYINAHELAHQWFGDCITMGSWSHIWLNEGFASYAEALWQEHLGGKDAYLAYMRSQERPSFNGSLYITDTTNIGALFGNTVYDKGSWVLHMLRGVLGDSLFLASLKTYATDPDYRYGSAKTDDFKETCERVSNRDLDWFFEQWVYRAGRPDYNAAWYTFGSGPYQSKLKIIQNNDFLYKMPLRIKLSDSESDTSFTVWNDHPIQEYYFTTAWIPDRLSIDPDGWVLKQVTLIYNGHYLTDRPDEFSVSQNYPNPFNTTTQININLPRDADVHIDIFNLLGQRVYADNFNLTAGYQIWAWTGRNTQGVLLPSGVYIYRIATTSESSTRKMILIR